MRVLVACEFSGRVRDSFIRLGHDAISCDLLESERPGPHVQGDVRELLKQEWDLVIAFPPCTYLAHSGIQWLSKQEGRWEKMLEAVEFFNLFQASACPRVCIENPIMHSHARSRLLVSNYDQKIQPYFFGHPESKSTCLWLKGLPKLKVTNNVERELFKVDHYCSQAVHRHGESKDRWRNRSRTYWGVAKAMASQWATCSTEGVCDARASTTQTA